MSARSWPLVVLTAAGILAACGKDNGGASEEDLTGTWQATKLEYASTTGPEAVELIATGCSATLVLNADNTLVYTFTNAHGIREILNASWELTGDIGDLMRVTPTGGTLYWAWDVSYSGNKLELSTEHSEYDFDHDSFGEPARWKVTLTR